MSTTFTTELTSTSQSIRFWQPEDGRVFDQPYSLDTETTLIDTERPWVVPALVVVGVFDGETAYLLTRNTAADFLRLHDDLLVVMHNAPFDLAVLQQAIGTKFDVYDLVERGLVRDTQILHRLLQLATLGSADIRGSSLADCSSFYLGVQIDKDCEDEEGERIRISFGHFLHTPETIPDAHIQYLLGDIETTYRLFEELKRRLSCLWLEINKTKPFGFVSQQSLRQSWKQFGPLTHNIQLKAAIVLREVTRNGLYIDMERLGPLRQELKAELVALDEQLAVHGYRPGSKGCKKALQRILRDIEGNNPGIIFPRTEKGYISEAAENLEPYADIVPFISTYLRFSEITKLLSTFLEKMARGILHPKFDILKNTGRTSAYGIPPACQIGGKNNRFENLCRPPRLLYQAG